MTKDKKQALLSRLAIVRTMSLAEAMDFLQVSESTVRRIFAELERSGVAIRTYGGIRCADGSPTAYSFDYVAKQNIDKKAAVASAACDMLEDGDVIFCDSGTTIQFFCAELVNRIRRDKLNVVLYTNSLANLELLSPHIPVNLLGGEYRANRKDFCGYITEQALRTVYFTKCFIGADGCIDERVFTTTDFETMRVNVLAMANSAKSYMLVDSSKFNMATHVAYAPIDRLYCVITDNCIDPKKLEILEKSETRIVCARVK